VTEQEIAKDSRDEASGGQAAEEGGQALREAVNVFPEKCADQHEDGDDRLAQDPDLASAWLAGTLRLVGPSSVQLLTVIVSVPPTRVIVIGLVGRRIWYGAFLDPAPTKTAAVATSGLKPIKAEVRDLFRRPLMAQELRDYNAVVFDPPRQGAQAQVRQLAASNVPVIVAVSCNAATFARDARILVDGGYELARVTPVDQFRHTPHVELVAGFRRKR